MAENARQILPCFRNSVGRLIQQYTIGDGASAIVKLVVVSRGVDVVYNDRYGILADHAEVEHFLTGVRRPSSQGDSCDVSYVLVSQKPNVPCHEFAWIG